MARTGLILALCLLTTEVQSGLAADSPPSVSRATSNLDEASFEAQLAELKDDEKFPPPRECFIRAREVWIDLSDFTPDRNDPV